MSACKKQRAKEQTLKQEEIKNARCPAPRPPGFPLSRTYPRTHTARGKLRETPDTIFKFPHFKSPLRNLT